MALPQSDLPQALRSKFLNFDDEATFKELRNRAVDVAASNFVVQFGDRNAQIALDLDAGELDLFVQHQDPAYPVRWVNIWSPSKQEDAVNRIGRYYGFSSRLCKTLAMRYTKNPEEGTSNATRERHVRGSSEKTAKDAEYDLEVGSNGAVEVVSLEPVVPNATARQEAYLLQLIKNTLNYTSIDHGDKFFCIGANWLHKRPELNHSKKAPSLVLPKHWSWFALCHDGTVLSFHEEPQYVVPKEDLKASDKAALEALELKSIRFNTYKVLSQLSSCGEKEFEGNVLTMTAIRKRSDPSSVEDARSVEDLRSEGSSNIFYYLFEDYSATISILRDSQKILVRITDRVLDSGGWKNKDHTGAIVRELYKLSKELRQLQHLFESYKTLIARITSKEGNNSDGRHHHINQTGVRLSQLARDRFDRLGDRVQLLMLNTIEECLAEKSALSDTYFNLTAQKDSQATARLSRSATLLAKLSVFFLPISFMTSYFGISIPNAMDGYTVRTYWDAFAAIASVSFVFLFFFSRLLMAISDVLDRQVDRTMAWFAGVLIGEAEEEAGGRGKGKGRGKEEGDGVGGGGGGDGKHGRRGVLAGWRRRRPAPRG